MDIPAPVEDKKRVRLVRREVKRYACGCSTTRIEAFSLSEPPEGCQAHKAPLLSETVTIVYEESEDLTVL